MANPVQEVKRVGGQAMSVKIALGEWRLKYVLLNGKPVCESTFNVACHQIQDFRQLEPPASIKREAIKIASKIMSEKKVLSS